MRRNIRACALVCALLCFTGCTLPWRVGADGDEELVAPETSVVERVKETETSEPEADEAYEAYAVVRIEAIAAVRFYVNTADGSDAVVYVQALNDKGEATLADEELNDIYFPDAVRIFIERAIEKGYIGDLDTAVIVSVEHIDSNSASGILEQAATEVIADCYAKHGMEADFSGERASSAE